MQVPCVTLRKNTERPESVHVGANILAHINPEKVMRAADAMLARDRKWVQPCGDGTAGLKIVRDMQEIHS